MPLYCDSRPAPIAFGAPNPYHANRTRLARENARATANQTVIGRSFPFPITPQQTITVQVVKATAKDLHVRPCLDLGEPAVGIARGTTFAISRLAAAPHLTPTTTAR